jgi:CheY-like chemotaxis protein
MQGQQVEPAMGRDRCVLVVDDDPDIRAVVALVLEDEGYSVETAANGAEALEKVRANPPSGILLDMMMPVMDGAAFLRAWRTEPPSRRVPVVVMSANRKAADALTLGASDFISKPFDVDDLLRLVDTRFRDAQGKEHGPLSRAS